MTPQEFRQFFDSAVQFHRAGDLDRAEAIYRQTLAASPNHPDAMHLLGVLLHQRGRHHEAIGLISHAIDLNPKSADYHGNLGTVWMSLGRTNLAINAYRNCLALDPQKADIYLNLAKALNAAGDHAGSATAAREAIHLKPDDAEGYAALGVALNHQGDLEPSIDAFRRAISLDPRDSVSHSNLIYAMEMHEDSDQASILAELKEWNRLHAQPVRHLIKPLKPRPQDNRRLRIGWVSPDFRRHVVARCLLPVLREFDRGQFENFCYSNSNRIDQTTFDFRSATDHWREIHQLTDEQAADLIRADELDVLVDLTLHSGLNRLPVFALKPAPVQVCYLGYCGSTGLETMDYRISHPYLDPPETDLTGYAEKTVHLASSYFCYRPESAVPDISPLPALANGFVTFSCLNNAVKASTQTVDLWGRILSEAANSRLIIYAQSASRREWIEARLKNHGIHPDRLEFIGWADWATYIGIYSRVDIALDTLPYNAGISACDALWMGVPIVTLAGNRPVGRMCGAILANIGQIDLIAQNHEEYVKIALHLASNQAELSQLRFRLRSRLESSPVMNAGVIAQELQHIFRKISLPNFSSLRAM